MRAAAVGLELDAILEVIEDTAVHIQTDESAGETGTAVGTFLVTVLVSADNVAAHFGSAHETGLIDPKFGSLRFLRGGNATAKQHGQSYCK